LKSAISRGNDRRDEWYWIDNQNGERHDNQKYACADGQAAVVGYAATHEDFTHNANDGIRIEYIFTSTC
jgi:hypothetical protein